MIFAFDDLCITAIIHHQTAQAATNVNYTPKTKFGDSQLSLKSSLISPLVLRWCWVYL